MHVGGALTLSQTQSFSLTNEIRYFLNWFQRDFIIHYGVVDGMIYNLINNLIKSTAFNNHACVHQ